MANLKEAFIIRPTDTNENEFMITIGNHLATEEKFKSRKAAEMRINKTDWNLVTAFVYALKEANYEQPLPLNQNPAFEPLVAPT